MNKLDPGVVVNSPTFSIENIYHAGKLSIIHQDLYRVGSEPSLWLELLDNLNTASPIFYYIEWPESLLPLTGLPKKDKLLIVNLQFKFIDSGRRIESSLL